MLLRARFMIRVGANFLKTGGAGSPGGAETLRQQINCSGVSG